MNSVLGVWQSQLGLIGIGLFLIAAIVVIRLRVASRALQVLSGLGRDQRGGAYSLAYTLSIFVLFLLVCVAIEMTQLMIAKNGVNYATFSAGRVASVYLPNQSLAQENAELAAVQSFVPFSRGLRSGDDVTMNREAEAYLEAMESFMDSKTNPDYVMRKWVNSRNRLQVEIDDQNPEDWEQGFFVTVRYQYPLMFPFLGVVLGTRQDAEYQRTLSSTFEFSKHSPQNREQQLGIDY